MQVYAVGELYNPRVTRWPVDNYQYNYRQDAHELVVFLTRPDSHEIRSIGKRPVEFALYVSGDVIFLLSLWNDGDWQESLYSWHRIPEDQRTIPETDAPDERRLLQVILVDSSNGIVRALRTVSFSAEFTRALHSAIRDQASRPYPGNAEFDRQVEAVYQKYPDTRKLAADASVRCRGGD